MQQPGTLIEGKYEILGKLSEGGMGTIYRVRHRLLEEIRVIKVLKPAALADEEMKRRFVEEARTATRLKHPNICTIHDFALDEEGRLISSWSSSMGSTSPIYSRARDHGA